MVMVPGAEKFGNESYENFLKLFKESVDEGLIPLNRINDAVKRILMIKKLKSRLEFHVEPAIDLTVLKEPFLLYTKNLMLILILEVFQYMLETKILNLKFYD